MMKNQRNSPQLLILFGLSLLALVGEIIIPGHAQSQNNFIYLPLIVLEDSCPLSAEEQAFAELIINDPDQQRAFMRCDPILSQVARERAVDMGTRDYFSHINPDGYGPNYLVQEAGDILPSFYNQTPTGNNIESICAGSSTASNAWNVLMSSDGHRIHLLGLDPFFAAQTDYGIGYAYIPGSTYGHYWFIVTAKKGP